MFVLKRFAGALHRAVRVLEHSELLDGVVLPLNDLVCFSKKKIFFLHILNWFFIFFQKIEMCSRLKDVLFQLYWRYVSTNKINKFKFKFIFFKKKSGVRCSARRRIRQLLENLVDRDARRPFCPPQHWSFIIYTLKYIYIY